MRCWRPVVTVVVAVCLLVAGCVSEWDRAMQALKADPMASASWEGMELLGENLPENEGPKPEPPGITRCYKIGMTVEEAIDTVLVTAEEHGWVEDPSVRRKGGAVARKEIEGTKVRLILSDSLASCEIHLNAGFRITIGYV